jgi:hexosaminidase
MKPGNWLSFVDRDSARNLASTTLSRSPILAACFFLWAATMLGQAASPLAAAGHAVLPVPQKVTLTGHEFILDDRWRVQIGDGVKDSAIAAESLKDGLATRFHLNLAQGRSNSAAAPSIRLALKPNSVSIGEAADRDKSVLAEQAYRLSLDEKAVRIEANAEAGLFYGVQTLLQLVRRRENRLWLPAGEVTDWPDLQLRVIYWDDAHHLERLDVLKNAVRQAAYFKINGFAIKLEGHFQHKSAPAMVEPYAMTPAELQELTNFALRYHVQIIPYLDGPAHVAFILKHPEYASLREFADSNYEFCATNPDTYKLLFGMFDDLMEATKGSKYFILSTDEPYYVGMAKSPQCDEATRAHELGSVGKLLAEFITKTGNYLHDHGRTVVFWGEFPMVPDDVPSLPSHMVNGEVHGNSFDDAFKSRGIRQLIYTSTQGEEPLFPNYYVLPPGRRLHPASGQGRVGGMFNQISFTAARQRSDLMGTVVAGWADAGLHPETFWLGYAAGPAAAWHPASASPAELMNAFYDLFYGADGRDIGRLYQLMSEQAQISDDTWEDVASTARPPIWGNSDKIFDPPQPAGDQSLPTLPVPSAGSLSIGHDWKQENSRRLEIASGALSDHDELLDLLHANLATVNDNRYNLEVFLSIAQIYRQSLEMIVDLGRISDQLKTAQTAAARGEARDALSAIDEALDQAGEIHRRRNRALKAATETWYKTWFPRVAEANGRRYLDQVDHVKDHRPIRTVDMSYLIYRELLYPLGDWAAQTLDARNEYARTHKLAERTNRLDWKDTSTN